MPAALWLLVLALAVIVAVAGLYLLVKAAIAWLIALVVGAVMTLVTWIGYALGAATLGWLGWSYWWQKIAERPSGGVIDAEFEPPDESWKPSPGCAYRAIGLACDDADAKLCVPC